tara:strand:+ start:14525 stop:15418 length:894 start_codon:yes stop_codon:yes gene_type:complete
MTKRQINWLQELRDNGHIMPYHGKEFILQTGLLYLVHRLFVNVSIDTEITFIDRDKRIAEAKATIKVAGPCKENTNAAAGSYSGHGDACPKTCNGPILNAYKRMAETRAVNRALRLICGGVIGLCTVEELEDHANENNKPHSPEPVSNTAALIKLKEWADDNGGLDRLIEYTDQWDYLNAVGPLLSWSPDRIHKFIDCMINNTKDTHEKYLNWQGKPTAEEIKQEQALQLLEEQAYGVEPKYDINDIGTPKDPHMAFAHETAKTIQSLISQTTINATESTHNNDSKYCGLTGDIMGD